MGLVAHREDVDMCIADRLYSKVQVLENGCWRYTGGLNGSGYGNIWQDGHTRSAHVVSYEIHNGPVPEGLNVLHSCDYKPCINPEHLFSGTQQDNIDDMINKDRHNFSGRALLTTEAVTEIRELLKETDLSQQCIADKFTVSRSTIAAIKSGRNWGQS